MNVYKISGVIVYTVWPKNLDTSDDFSDAFDGIDKRHRVSQIVVAENREAALSALEAIPGALPDSSWWDRDDLETLTIETAPPDVAMKVLGMPTLFEVEPTP